MNSKKHSLFQNISYVYKKVFHYNSRLKFKISIKIICDIVIPILSMLISAVAVGLIVSGTDISKYLISMGAITVLYSVAIYIKSYLESDLNMENTCARISEFSLKGALNMMRMDYCNIEPQEKQKTMQKAINSTYDSWVGPEFIMKSMPDFISNFIGFVLYSLAIVTLDIRILCILIAMSLMNYMLFRYAKNYEAKHKDDYVVYDKKISYLYENSVSLVNGKDVRIYKMEKWFYKLFQALIKKRTIWSYKIQFRYFLPSLSDNILLMIRDAVAYGILINKVLAGSIGAAEFTLYLGIVSGFSLWMSKIISAISNLQKASLDVDDYRAYHEMENVFRHEGNPKTQVGKSGALSIEIKDVSFRYEGAEKDTLSHVNLSINPGQKIALVGSNGAGKTTLVKLLCGLYYPTDGEILVGGRSIRDYNITEYYEIIAAIFQDMELFPFTIAQNVSACKVSEIDYEKVHSCLKKAGLWEKVQSLKDKEKTYLTQCLDKNGLLLSGGEMQKMMLARTLYKDAPLMILDEPTAALDPIAENELYEKYNDLTKDKTSIFISHRLASTRFCDRIIFLENGKILEDGTHDSLMKQNGRYAEMFNIQSHYYRESKFPSERENSINNNGNGLYSKGYINESFDDVKVGEVYE